MKKNILILWFSLGAMMLATQHAFAQQARNCAPRDSVLERLSSRYGESRQSVGLASNNAVIETFASLETGTWTIVVTLNNGMTCLMAAGQGFEFVDSPAVKPGHDT